MADDMIEMDWWLGKVGGEGDNTEKDGQSVIDSPSSMKGSAGARRERRSDVMGTLDVRDGERTHRAAWLSRESRDILYHEAQIVVGIPADGRS